MSERCVGSWSEKDRPVAKVAQTRKTRAVQRLQLLTIVSSHVEVKLEVMFDLLKETGMTGVSRRLACDGCTENSRAPSCSSPSWSGS